MFIDTNIASGVKNGTLSRSIWKANISSVAASELLLVYSRSRTAAHYYVPVLPSRYPGMSIPSSKRDHPYSKQSTDRIVFSFGTDFPPLVEFGSLAVSQMVNQRDAGLLKQSIAFLDKARRKVVRENFDFLAAHEITCVPLTPASVQRAYDLLAAFRASGGQCKSAFRNSWNDILILSVAQENRDSLLSADNELNRFSASIFGEFKEESMGTLMLCWPSKTSARQEENSRESKGYINRGWMATFKAGRRQAL